MFKVFNEEIEVNGKKIVLKLVKLLDKQMVP